MYTKKWTLVVFIVLFSFYGCAAIDAALSHRGKMTKEISKMDGKKVVSVTPALVTSGFDSYLEIGLYWDSDKGDTAHLVVQAPEATLFSREKPIEFKVDGKMYLFEPVDKQDFGDLGIDSVLHNNITTKSYFIKKGDILSLANGKSGAYRLHYSDNKYIEGDITHTWQSIHSYFPLPFREFYEEVWGGAK